MQTDLWKMTCKLAAVGICVVNMCVLNSGAISQLFQLNSYFLINTSLQQRLTILFEVVGYSLTPKSSFL